MMNYPEGPSPGLNKADTQPAGLLSSIAADIAQLIDTATSASLSLRDVRGRVLGPWPEDATATGAGREPSSESERLANLIGALRGTLLDVRDQASYLNREI